MSSFDTNDELTRIVIEALEQRSEGIEPNLPELCGGRAELVSEVERALQITSRLPTLQNEATQRDPYRGLLLENRYRVDHRLGAGSMGVVYQGHDTDLDRPVAIKFLSSSLFLESEAAARFEREAETLAAIEHPAILTIYDRGTLPDSDSYLVLELLTGIPANSIVERGAELAEERGGAEHLTDCSWLHELADDARVNRSDTYVRTAVQWIADVAEGLQSAHDAGVIHRDVKPSNLFIRADGRATLLDFGVATRQSQATLRAAGNSPIGTIAYSAPEQLKQGGSTEPTLDVYALTATLYHLLTFEAPFSGTPSEVVARIQRADVVPAHKIRRGIPADLQAILERGMETDLKRRYGSARALSQDLRAFLEYRPVAARPRSAASKVWRRVSRSNFARAAALGVILTGASLGGLAWHKEAQASSRSTFDHVYARLLPAITMWGPDAATNRIDDPERRSRTLAQLTTMVENDDEWMWGHILRAVFRSDHGETKGAHADMQRVADAFDTATAREIARQFIASDDEATAIDFAQVPKPTSAKGRLLYGYFLIRAARTPNERLIACDYFEHESLRSMHVAMELAIATRYAARREVPREDRDDLARTLFERTVRLEENRGHRTAWSAQIAAQTLASQRLYREAFPFTQTGLALCADAHQLHLAAGIILRRGERFVDAVAAINRSIELRPSLEPAIVSLCRTLIESKRFDEADRTIEESAFASERMRFVLFAELAYKRTVDHLTANRESEAIAAARRSVEAFNLAAGRSRTRPFGYFVSTTIADGDRDAHWPALVRGAGGDLSNHTKIGAIIDLMPDKLEEKHRDALKNYLRSLQQHFRESDALDLALTPPKPIPGPRK